jgi:hypothetical protein
MAVSDELPRLSSRTPKTERKDHIIETPFKQLKQLLTCNALHSSSLLKVASELFLKHTVGPLDFLLFAQLLAIAHQLSAPEEASSMLTREEVSLVYRALVR